MQKNKFSKIKEWVKRNGVIDVILFGSYARNKDKPGDMDICLIIPDEKEKESIELLSSFKQFLKKENAHISIITEKDFITGSNTLVKTLLSEGISVTNKEPLSRLYGFENKTLFTYSLKGFKPSDRVRFHYALRGRRGVKGILSEAEAKMLGDGVIIIPTKNEDLLNELFNFWKVKYETRRVLFG